MMSEFCERLRSLLSGAGPETVFGMIENQRIQLSELIEALEGPTEILEKDLSPGATMSHVDQAWVSLAAESPEKTSETIRMHLTGLCQEAESHLDPVSQSLGFSLPRPEEVEGNESACLRAAPGTY